MMDGLASIQVLTPELYMSLLVAPETEAVRKVRSGVQLPDITCYETDTLIGCSSDVAIHLTLGARWIGRREAVLKMKKC